MKKEKLLIISILIALFAVTWIATISATAGIEKKKEQLEKYNEAHILLGKELYVRAIPLYEEALEIIDSDNNAAIEAELLQAYYGHGDVNKYTKLVESRLKQKTATEDEILQASRIYMDRFQIDDAISVLDSGIDLYDSEILKETYENDAYLYKIQTTRFQTIRPSINQNLLAAFDGEVWEYIDPDFAWSLDESEESKYEYASSYTKDGYALVKKNGVYYVILENGDRYGVAETDFEDVFDVSGKHVLAKKDGKYSYYNFDFENVAAAHNYDIISNNACGCAAVNKDGKWGIISDGGKVIVDFNLDDVAINSLGRAFSNNVAMVKKDGSWHLIDNEGKDVIEQTFSNAKAPESDGYIAVADESGAWGFIDRKGNLVIDYSFTDAKSFSDGTAAVLNGMYWNYISTRGNIVIDENFVEATPFHNGTAVAYSDTSAVLVKLNYVKSSKY